MKCQKAQEWLSQAMDGELDASSRLKLDQHLASCQTCRSVRTDWERAGVLLRSEVVAAPPAEVLWADVRRAIRVTQPEAEPAVPGWRLKWASAFVGGLLLVMGVWGALHSARQGETSVARVEQESSVEWAEAELPGTSTMVYEDAENDTVVIWLMAADNAGEAPKGT